MEVVAIVGLALFLVSEVMPFTPLHSNGLAQAILESLRRAFPKPEPSKPEPPKE